MTKMPEFPPEVVEAMIQKFEQSEVENPGMVPLMIAITAIAMSLVLLRLITRRFILRSIGRDDIIIMPAAAIALIYSIFGIRMQDYGWGHHIYEIPPLPEYMRNSYFHTFLCMLFFIVSITLVRCSILFFYLRMSHVLSSPSFKLLTYIVLGYSICWGISMFIMVFLQCSPIHNFWTTDLELRTKTCNKWSDREPSWLYAQGVTNILGDILVLVLPMKVVCDLTIPRKEKIGLFGLFGLGALACLCELLRVIYAAKIYFHTDITWKGYYGFVLGIVEVQVGIMCASIPATKPFWALLYAKVKSLTLNSLHRSKEQTFDKSWMTGTTITGNGGTHNGHDHVDRNGYQQHPDGDNDAARNDEDEISQGDSYHGESGRDSYKRDTYDRDVESHRMSRIEPARQILNVQDFERGYMSGNGGENKETV